MKGPLWMVVVLAAALGLALGAGVRYWWLSPASPPAGTGTAPAPAEPAEPEVVGRARPAFTLADLDGEARAIADFDGQVVLLNFWATWCPPCIEEVPALDALHEARAGDGLRVLGVALEARDPVAAFAREHDVGYPLLPGGRDAFEIVAVYGNARGTLPYTVVIDRDGIVRATHQGALTRAEASALVEPWL